MSWYSWWTGAIGPRKSDSKRKADVPKVEEGKQKVALIIGITGIVGNSLAEILPGPETPGGPWKVYGVARREKPDWFIGRGVTYIQCDALDRDEVLEKISALEDVTHLFWVARVHRQTEEENCWDNESMLRNVLDALLPNAPNFQHICLQTGGKHYISPVSPVGDVELHDPPFSEDMPRLAGPNFYYNLEDLVFDAVGRKRGLTWSIHRPSAVVGFSPFSRFSMLRSLAVYAAICKKEGIPFRYPGNEVMWEQFSDLSDADLIAEQEIWGATDPNARNEVYNITNGDVFNYKRVWRLFAMKFDLELVPPNVGSSSSSSGPFSLAEMMKEKGSVWDEIVAENGLWPTALKDVGHWEFTDELLNLPSSPILSMNKSKELGFFGFRNTETSILYWIDKMRERKIIP